ncbi:MAG: BolA family protein [Halobacteria archaeon]|nr:BolA family protein [Halobacteria archaeon]
MEPDEVRDMISDGIPEAEVEVIEEEDEDERSEGDHFAVVVVSPAFENETKVSRHRMVYDALGDSLGDGGDIHAVEIDARAPGE